jgi:hypothetical protein
MFVKAQGQPAKIAGNWEMTLQAPQGGSFAFTLLIEQDASKIRGKLHSQFTGDTTDIEGTITGNDLAFRSTVAGPSGDLDGAFKGTVKGDAVEGTAMLGEYVCGWSARHQK